MEMIVGAGKTFFITWACRKGDVILTDRRITVGEIVKDVSGRGISPAEVPVCTGSSYLINRDQEYERLFIDEASMMHWGFIVALIQIIKPKVVILCGDKEQISFVIRDTTMPVFYKNVPLSVDRYYTSVTWRTPADACMLFSDIYKRPIYTMNQNLRGYKTVKMPTEKDYSIIEHVDGAHYICLVNEEVKLLKDHLKKRGISNYVISTVPAVTKKGGEVKLETVTVKNDRVTTAHVAEGGTWDHVIIVRAKRVTYSIHSDLQHILVATSRHKKSCTYYSVEIQKDRMWHAMNRVIGMKDEELINRRLRPIEMEKAIIKKGKKYMASFKKHPLMNL
jgi:hypothetical protein